MNPNQPNNGLPPLPQGQQPAPAQPVLYQPPTQDQQNMPTENTKTTTTTVSSQWNSTPWIVGIFVMLILIVILTMVALNVYTRPSSSASNSSSSVASSTSADNTYEVTLSKTSFDATAGEWSYEITGFLPTHCHTAAAEVMIMESFPEQVVINVNFTEPPADTVCIQVLKDLTLTGKFKASEGATTRIGTVKVV